MTDFRNEKPIIIDDTGSVAGWLFALVMAAILAFGAWYFLSVSGTAIDANAGLDIGASDAAAQLHLVSAGNSRDD